MTRSSLALVLRGDGVPERIATERPLFAVEYATLPPDVGFDFAWDGSSAYLALHDMVNRDGEIEGDGIPRTPSRDMRRRMTLLPEGVRVKGWVVPESRLNSFTALYFDQNWIFDQLEVSASQRTLQPHVLFHDRTLLPTLEKLSSLARNPATAPQLMLDSLAMLAAAEAIRINGARTRKEGGLSQKQLAAAIDYIDAHLAEDISLQDIANAADLSTFHFSRAFKQSTGMTPYRHLMQARIEHAKLLMRAPSPIPVAQIAVQAGFKSASHFSRTFAEIAGLSPREFRRQFRR